MLNWNWPIIDYYRDRFLLWPVLIFSMLAIVNIVSPESPAGRLYGFKLAACAIIALLLAKERLIMLLAGAGFVALRLTVALAVSRDWKAYGVGFLVSIGIIVALLPALRRWKSSDEDPATTKIPGVLFGVAGIVASVAVVLLLKP